MPPERGSQNSKRSIYDQPRKAISGILFSGTIIGMLLISLAFSITVSVLVKVLEKPLEEISATEAYKYCSYLLYQFVYVVIVLVYMKIYKARLESFGWRKANWKYLLLAVPLAFGLLFSLNWVNAVFVKVLSLIGYQQAESNLPSVAGGGLVGVLIVVALLPALLEETILRGIVLEGIKDIGTVAACIFGGLLFSLFHQNPTQTVYQFICGAVFTLVAIRADSLLPSVLIHFLNNAVIVMDYKFDFLSKISVGGTVALYVLSGICLISSLVYLLFIDKRGNRKKENSVKPFLYPALAGIILCILMWILNFIGGFGG